MADRILEDAFNSTSPLADVEDVLNSMRLDDLENETIALNEFECSDSEEDNLELLDEPMDNKPASVTEIRCEIRQMLDEADREGLLPRECDGLSAAKTTKNMVIWEPILNNNRGMPVFLDERFFKFKEYQPMSNDTGLNNLDEPQNMTFSDKFSTLFSHEHTHKRQIQRVNA